MGNFYFLDGVGEHLLEGFDFLYDVVDILLLILAEEVPILLHVFSQLPLQFPRLLLVEDTCSFLLLVEFLEIDVVFDLWDVEDGSQVLDGFHGAGAYIIINYSNEKIII